MKRVVYTAVSGGYDIVLPPKFRDEGAEYVLFTDQPPRLSRGWIVRPLPAETRGMTPAEANRWCKFFAHRIFPNIEETVYIDGNTRQLSSFNPFFDQMKKYDAEIGLFPHCNSLTILDEFQNCSINGKIPKEELDFYIHKIDEYNKLLKNTHYKLTENSIIFRRFKSDRLDFAMNEWWIQFINGIKRDQISLPWVLKRTNIDSYIFLKSFRLYDPPFLKIFYHRSPSTFLEDMYFISRLLHKDSLYYYIIFRALHRIRAVRRYALGLS